MKNRGGKFGRNKFDVTDTSWPKERHSQVPKFGPNGSKSRTAISKAFKDTPTAISPGKGNYTYV